MILVSVFSLMSMMITELLFDSEKDDWSGSITMSNIGCSDCLVLLPAGSIYIDQYCTSLESRVRTYYDTVTVCLFAMMLLYRF